VTYDPKDVVQTECRFAFHTEHKESGDDLHLIKEAVTLKDGRTVPNVRLVKNYKRPFWISKKGNRDFKELKEREFLPKLDRFESTQHDLATAVSRALGKGGYHRGLRNLCQEPYVFGVDISSTAIIKHELNKKVENITPYTVAVYDTETDAVHGTGEVIINTISFKNRVFCAIKSSYLKGISMPVEQIRKLIDTYLGEIVAKRQAVIEIVVCETEYETIKTCIDKAHEWMPDFVSVWNIDFDMDKIIDACKKENIDPAELLCSPDLPKEFRFFNFKKGPAKKVTASGRVINFSPSQRWHFVNCPASFHWIDGMQAYRQVRSGGAEEPSYALDAILTKHKIPSKLKFKDLDDDAIPAAGTLPWHAEMQSRYPLHYVVYNIYDCIGVELLDESIKDLSLSMPMFARSTDFENFNSQPRKSMNDLHWEFLEDGSVAGATASEMTVEDDALTTSVSGWITMLQAHQIYDNGLCLIDEVSDLRTLIRIACADLDVSAAYPTNESVCNVSKETTARELILVKTADGEEIPEEIVRMQTINFSGGITNAVEFCTTMFGMPQLHELVKHYDDEKNNLQTSHFEGYVSRFANWLSKAVKTVAA
jgi:hypothetical protein